MSETLTDAQVNFIRTLAAHDDLIVSIQDAEFIAGGGMDLAARGLIFDEAFPGFREVQVTGDAIELAKLINTNELEA